MPAKSARNGKGQRKPRKVDEMTQHNVQKIMKLEAAAKANRDYSDYIADVIARFCGSMPFVWAHVIWFGGWIIINLTPGLPHFDPFPFGLLTLVVSLEAIFLSTFILISQNYENRLSDRRNQLDLQINLLAEQENTKMLAILERIAKKVGATIDDPALRALEQSTQPEKLIDQIEQAAEQGTASTRNNRHSGTKPS